MDLNALLGSDESTVKVGDKEYRLTPKTIADYAEIDRFILSRRTDPIALVASIPPALTPAERARITDALIERSARARMVTPVEIQEYFSSITGIAHQVWMAARTHQPEIDSLEMATDLVLKMGFQEAIDAAAATRQEEAIKN